MQFRHFTFYFFCVFSVCPFVRSPVRWTLISMNKWKINEYKWNLSNYCRRIYCQSQNHRSFNTPPDGELHNSNFQLSWTLRRVHIRIVCLIYLQSLRRTYQNRGRKYPPSSKEILFITKRLALLSVSLLYVFLNWPLSIVCFNPSSVKVFKRSVQNTDFTTFVAFLNTLLCVLHASVCKLFSQIVAENGDKLSEDS